ALNAKGVSVIFSTHRMEQVEQLCEHLVLINKGKNVLQGRVAEIKDRFKEGIFRVLADESMNGNLDGLNILSQSTYEFTLKADPGKSPNDLLRDLMNRGLTIHGFEEIKPSLNEIFIKTVKDLDHA